MHLKKEQKSDPRPGRFRWRSLFLSATILVVVYLSIFTVSETEFVLITQFGRPVREHREAGLKVKWPIQGITRLDKRAHLYHPRPSEYLTQDKKNLLVQNYVLWRIEDPLLFIRTVRDRSGAEMRLHDIVWSQVSAALGQTELSRLVSTDGSQLRTAQLTSEVTAECRQIAQKRYGIDIETVEISRLNLPAQNRDSVFARMRAERDRIAKRYRAEGEEEARKIRAEADRQAEELLAEAKKQAEIIRGEGDAQAAAIYGKAFSRDPEFYQMVRTLQAYEKILDEKTIAVLSTDSELLKLLTEGRNGRLFN